MNTREIKDYIHLYLWCKVLAPCPYEEKEGETAVLTGIREGTFAEVQYIVNGHAFEEPSYCELNLIKLILRPLSQMTKDEYDELCDIRELSSLAETDSNSFLMESKSTKYLLSKGFDIFDLHKDGLCIYESELTKEQQ